MSKTNSYTASGVGTIPAPIDIIGTNVTSNTALSTKLEVNGNPVENKTLYQGDKIFADNSLRTVLGFYPNGDILIDAPFTTPLVNVDLKRVKKNRFKEVAIVNQSQTITGTTDGEDLLPKKGLEWKAKDGVDSIIYDANGGSFKISTITTT